MFVYLIISALLPLQQLIRETIEYTNTRKAFGRPILDNQTVHYTLAELETEVELLRSLLYRTVGEYQSDSHMPVDHCCMQLLVSISQTLICLLINVV